MTTITQYGMEQHHSVEQVALVAVKVQILLTAGGKVNVEMEAGA